MRNTSVFRISFTTLTVYAFVLNKRGHNEKLFVLLSFNLFWQIKPGALSSMTLLHRLRILYDVVTTICVRDAHFHPLRSEKPWENRILRSEVNSASEHEHIWTTSVFRINRFPWKGCFLCIFFFFSNRYFPWNRDFFVAWILLMWKKKQLWRPYNFDISHDVNLKISILHMM